MLDVRSVELVALVFALNLEAADALGHARVKSIRRLREPTINSGLIHHLLLWNHGEGNMRFFFQEGDIGQ